MTGNERRDRILKCIMDSERPLSASKLAELCGVSRQVIVQDVALIRAGGHDIMSTNRGYILNEKEAAASWRVLKVSHTEEELEDELTTIIDLGGLVRDVSVNHKVYGRMEARLGIGSRRRIAEFMNDIRSGKSTPLMRITSNYHYHTIEADSDRTLDLIEEALKEKGYLVSPKKETEKV